MPDRGKSCSFFSIITLLDISFLTHTWYGAVLFIVFCGHVTIMCTSLYLHRSITHEAVRFSSPISMLMRLWLWFFTGMSTKHWVSVHRKHHVFTDVDGDPHSPLLNGWTQIMFFGVKYYRAAYADPAAMEKYTVGCPDDWMERHVFEPHKYTGPVLLLIINVLLFGFVAGPLLWLGQVLWVPFWAAGVVNGLGHTIGYRNYKVKDASRNLIPMGLLLSGEELHNNHHKFPSSAKFSKRWFEFDMGWTYIQMLRAFGLAKVKVVQNAKSDFKAKAEHAKEVAVARVHAATTAAKEMAQAAKDATAPAIVPAEG